MEQKEQQKTAAQLWREKKKTRPVELPSGMIVQIKESVLYAAMIANVVPLPLLKRVIAGTMKDAPPDEAVQIPSAVRQMGLLAMQIVAEPKIVDSLLPGPNEIALIDVPDEDLIFIIGMLFRNGEAESLTSFRDRRGGDSPRSDVPALQPTAVNGNAD